MKRVINGMAVNTTGGFKSCIAQWVAYECFRQIEGRDIRVSNNTPGKIIVLSSTNKYPNQNIEFHITPVDLYTVRVVVELDNFDKMLSAADAVSVILKY